MKASDGWLPFMLSNEKTDCEEKRDEKFVGFDAPGVAVIDDSLSRSETGCGGSVRVAIEGIGCFACKEDCRPVAAVVDRSRQQLRRCFVLFSGHREIRVGAQEIRFVHPVAANCAHCSWQLRQIQRSTEQPHAVVDNPVVVELVELGTSAD